MSQIDTLSYKTPILIFSIRHSVNFPRTQLFPNPH